MRTLAGRSARLRIAVCLLVVVAVSALAGGRAWGAPPPPSVGARAAALYDPQAARLLYGQAADQELPVASLTKIMTAWLALQQPSETPIRVRDDVLGLPETKAGLVPGRTYTLAELLPVLIVRSANDAAVAIADGLGGSVPAFAAEMNAAAQGLGLHATHYVNPAGLDAPGQYSSARDVAVLAARAMADPAFRALAGLRQASLPGGATFDDLNPFLAAYPGADGIKTGYTSGAGFCLAASAVRDGRRLIAVVLHEPSWAAAVRDASQLLDWGFAQQPAPPAPARQPQPDGAAPTPVAVGQPAAPTAPAPATPPATTTPPPAPVTGSDGGVAVRLAAAAVLLTLAGASARRRGPSR